MDRRLHKVYDADKLFYYFFSENESCNLVLRFRLRERVDHALLKKALNKTLDRYPNFRQTPVLDQEGYLYTMDNDREAEVYPYDPYPADLGSKDTNGYLFRVMYEGSTLWISVFHGVCDGRGYMMFARTLLYEYFTMAGYPVDNEEGNILTENISEDPTEMADPFEIKLDAKPAANPFKPTGQENIFTLPVDNKGTDQCRNYGLFRYILDTDRLVSLAKQAGTTVDNYFHLLMARLIRDNYEIGDKMISGMGAVDLRPYYGSRYLQNLRELFWIHYTGDFDRLPDQDAGNIIKDQFKGPQLSKENFDGVLMESKISLKEMLSFPLAFADGLKIMRERVWVAPELLVTYFTTNLGRFELGSDLDRHVEHVDMYGPAIFQCPGIFLLTQGKETSISLTQRCFNRDLALKLKEAFEREGLLISDELGTWFENDKVRVDRIPRI